MKKILIIVFSALFAIGLSNCSGDFESGEALEQSQNDQNTGAGISPVNDNQNAEEPEPTPEDPILEEDPACLKSLYYDQFQPLFSARNCQPANQTQIQQVDQGNLKKDEFLAQCYQETNGSCWCDQLIRPNPTSINTFHCTYGNDQVHQLIHPDESTWKFAFEAVKIVEEFEDENILTEIIYNWWRPEPYNKNVGGSASRHPFGTAVDVRFKSKSMQNKAFDELCKMRKQGRLRAIGYYSSTAIHFGIGDSTANTWGKACP